MTSLYGFLMANAGKERNSRDSFGVLKALYWLKVETPLSQRPVVVVSHVELE